jgi:hypothetical protein
MVEANRNGVSQRLSWMSKAWVGAVVVFAVVSGLVLGMRARQPVVYAADGAKAVDVSAGGSPTYTADGKMLFPEKYREWIYLTTGHDMSYTPVAAGRGMASGGVSLVFEYGDLA